MRAPLKPPNFIQNTPINPRISLLLWTTSPSQIKREAQSSHQKSSNRPQYNVYCPPILRSSLTPPLSPVTVILPRTGRGEICYPPLISELRRSRALFSFAPPLPSRQPTRRHVTCLGLVLGSKPERTISSVTCPWRAEGPRTLTNSRPLHTGKAKSRIRSTGLREPSVETSGVPSCTGTC